MAIRFDRSGSLGKVKRTPQGGIVAPAGVTRTGILEYTNPDGTIRREYRSDAEVFAADSLETLMHAPVTRLHPAVMVTSKNFKKYSVGHVSTVPRKDTDGVHVVTDVVVQDEDTIAEVDKGGLRELSCGYSCDLEEVPGITPTGERYDAAQKNIRYNHLALVPRGRAGRNAALRLDAENNQVPEGTEEDPPTMKITERIDGVDYEVGTDPHKAAAKRRDEAEGARAAELAQLRTDLAAEKARADAMSERIETAVQTRLQLIEQARTVGVDNVVVTMTEADLQRAIAGKVLPGVDLEGRSSDFLAGAIAAAKPVEAAPQGTGASAAQVRADLARRARTDAQDEGPSRAEIAHAKMLSNLRAEGRK